MPKLLPALDPVEALDEDGNIIVHRTIEEARAWLDTVKAKWDAGAEKIAWLQERGLPLTTTDEEINDIQEAEWEAENSEGDVPDTDLDDYDDL